MVVIEEYSSKGVWFGFLIPHSFFVIVRVKVVNLDYRKHAAYCKTPSMNILGHAVGHWILWSGYKVRPLDAGLPIP
jgi:hypothetical protein